ncbi:phosphate ABC transporter permease PstA [Cryobacterium sp. TMS1-20-1]|uniref:Phosphate transport system permease protein PstA n=1 Tax=Cryobacterium levicorallinum TaxID=995038 RepID=A0A1I3ANV4_9MICO|nr:MULTISPECIES: phosphate ABC transporter permease PstA [Cryobacterium]TFB88078.1 phosphate ABC transporter permease PstA [Cryobacterium levicorallinum]TFC69529.1 phosphate ABC transporter permease PstA [Cryobacterium sp. TMS1-20-1]TFD55647.1 phosphate ABC transporter permease PstA [Cryobacterium sp. Hh38]SFH51466.1 phosphate transport system permease protein [Cryobacterium levicorallinum]GEP26721.1 phosphate transport system permease protein PstA [Cryobacterium levicorallinum]
MTSVLEASPLTNSLTAGKLPRRSSLWVLLASWAVSAAFFAMLFLSGSVDGFNVVGTVVFGTVLYCVAIYVLSRLVEGSRKAKDRLMTALVTAAFVIALLPLVSIIYTTVVNGLPAFLTPTFFTSSQRNVVGAGGGVLHAVIGTLMVTGMATLISVPIGLLASIYLVEYGRGKLAKAITFFVDVMTGIPSIVAGLFAFALFALLFDDPGIRFGFGGAIALSVLMIPVVVRSSEEMLKLVPNELREAAFALGVPKWLTILKVVLPTSIAGIVTGVMLSIARVIGETAPLLIIAGFTSSMNYDLFGERMMTLPVFVYTQYANQGADSQAYIDRAWAGALTLILIVMLLNGLARLIAHWFSPKLGR